MVGMHTSARPHVAHALFVALIASALLFLCAVFPANAQASGQVNTNSSVSANLVYTSNEATGTPIQGAQFRLYYVYALEEDGSVGAVAAGFADAPVAKPSANATNDEWQALAGTLSAYIAKANAESYARTGENAINPDAQGATSANGRLTLAPDTKAGVYLLLGEPASVTNDDGSVTTYTPKATMLTLPVLDSSGQWDYSATVYPKKSSDTTEPTAKTTHVSVIVTWEELDGHMAAHRPDSVTVKLYKTENGISTLYGTQEVNASMSWRYTWADVPANATWDLAEDPVPDNYVTAVEFFLAGETPFSVSDNPVAAFIPDESAQDVTAQDVYGASLAAAHSSSSVYAAVAQATASAYAEEDAADASVLAVAQGNDPSVSYDEGVFVVTNTCSDTQSSTVVPASSTKSGTDGSASALPKTGQAWWPVPLLVGIGLLFIVLGFWAKRRQER